MESGFYRHYKGSIYYVICDAINAKDNNTQEKFVVYKLIDCDKIFVRPYSEFQEFVEIDGERLRRFKKIENNIPKIPNTQVFDYDCSRTFIHELPPPTEIPHFHNEIL